MSTPNQSTDPQRPHGQEAIAVVGALADRDRRRVLAALILGERDWPLPFSKIAEVAELHTREAIAAVTHLCGTGIVSGSLDLGYSLASNRFVEIVKVARDPGTSQDGSLWKNYPSVHRRVLSSAIVDGKLVRLPSKRSKRLVVLDFLAQGFEIGKRYQESEVNERLRAFDDDVASLRRWLVDEGFLDRAAGWYWRCGGSV